MLRGKLDNARGILSPRGWVVLVALAWLIAAVSVQAQVDPMQSRQSRQPRQSEPETIRAALGNVLDLQQATATMIGNTEAEKIIAQTIVLLEQATEAELLVFEGLAGSIAELQAKQEALYSQLETMEQLGMSTSDWKSLITQHALYFAPPAVADADYIGLTDANYGFFCSSLNVASDPPFTPNQSNSDANRVLMVALTVSDAALVVAEGVRDVAGVFCNQVVVICPAPGGGNPGNPACVISEGVYIAAKIINEGLDIGYRIYTFCDDTIAGAEIEGTYERAADIYDQNVDIDADLVAHDTNLAAHDARLALHDAEVAGKFDLVQATLDNTVEMKRVHLQVIQLKPGDHEDDDSDDDSDDTHRRFLLVSTEAGVPVDATLSSIQISSGNGNLTFVDVTSDTTSAVPKLGMLDVRITLPRGLRSARIFEFRVEHADGEDPVLGPIVHFGTTVVHRRDDDDSDSD